MAGTIIADYIRSDANQLSLNVGNTTFATINASGFFSNTGIQLIAANGKISGASVIASSIPTAAIADSAITTGKIGYAGAVLQTVYAQINSSISINSTTFATTGLSATITPTRSNSKILAKISGSFYNSGSGVLYFTLYRGATNLEPTSGRGFIECNTNGTGGSGTAVNYLDSPATTSSTTYTVYWKNGGINISYWCVDGTPATLTLMEIAQ
jgi:hypothetical protein